MAEQRTDLSGKALGPYQLTRLLGAGSFGVVYEAEHQLLQQKRAIKLLLEHHFHDPHQHERFLREARTLATLEHSNILPVLEAGEEGTMLYLVMPFYRRGTLNDLLKQHSTPLPLDEVERLLAQMCAAVGYAHTRNIAHLDLKPENMLLHEDGRLILSDFGLAHLIKQGRLEAGSSASWGTPHYMAPEQNSGEPELRSDLYALGVILYQLLTNQRPFTGNTPEAVMMKHLLEAPPPLRAASPEVPTTLEPVVKKALEKKPEDRYPTAEELLADFRSMMSSPPLRFAQSQVPTKTVNQWGREGDTHLKAGRYVEAVTAYDQAIADYGQPIDLAIDSSFLLYSSKASALFALERYEEALTAYDQAIDRFGSLFDYCNKADTLAALQRYEEAAATYQQVIDYGRSDILHIAYYKKGNALSNLKCNEEALVAYDQAIAEDPKDATAHHNKGIDLRDLESHEHDEALAAYLRAIDLNPNDAIAHHHKGYTLYNLRRYDEALAAYDRAIDLNPTYAVAYHNKGRVLEELRRKEEAEQVYNKALQLGFRVKHF